MRCWGVVTSLTSVLLLFLQAASWPVSVINVHGAKRLAPNDIAAASGLKPGVNAGSVDLEAACARLMKTGLFESCRFEYSPAGRGTQVEFTVAELPAEQTARLIVAGVDDKRLWTWLRQNEPLVQERMPLNDDAVQFYTAAVQRFLKAEGFDQDITVNIESDLRSREQTFVFRPKNLPVILDVRFTGVSSIPDSRLRDALLPVAKGTPFTEFDIRRLFDLNVKPLLEREGRLQVGVSSVTGEMKDEGTLVTIGIDEGPVFRLRAVNVTGDMTANPDLLKRAGYPIGGIANWTAIEAASDYLKEQLRNEGYLATKYKLARALNNDATVDVTASFERGPVFSFGQLYLDGLLEPVAERLRSVWSLREGEPMNNGYIKQFLETANPLIPKQITGISIDTPIRPGTTIADVRIKFGR